MADITQQKKQRKTIKTSLTRILNYCQQVNVTKENVKVRAERSADLFAQYNEIQAKIDEVTPDNQQEEEEQYRAEIEETFYAIQARQYQLEGDDSMRAQETAQQGNSDIVSAMQTLMQNQNTMASLMERFSQNIQAGNTSTPNENRQQQNELQLPRVQLPNFDGNLLDWVRFKDLFEALVHTKTSISNVEKLEYLHSKLTGDALLVIKHLKPTNSNYEIAWNLLNRKYNNADKIKNSYIELIVEQNKMKSSSNRTIYHLAIGHWDVLPNYIPVMTD